jgi:hypothetical protein
MQVAVAVAVTLEQQNPLVLEVLEVVALVDTIQMVQLEQQILVVEGVVAVLQEQLQVVLVVVE